MRILRSVYFISKKKVLKERYYLDLVSQELTRQRHFYKQKVNKDSKFRHRDKVR